VTPERVAAIVARWVRVYTRNLPPAVARRRVGEIDADLHDQIAHERAGGTGDRRIAMSIAARMLRGMAADAAWRSRMRARASTPRSVSRSVVRVGLVTASILLVPLLAMQVSAGVHWDLGDFVFAGTFLAGSGLLLELVARRPRNVVYRIAAAALGLAAIGFGNADDAPGLVLFGCLLIAGTVAVALWTAQRSE
jgi:hypothetical protein